MQRYFQKANIVPNVKLELTSSEAVKAGLGYSMQSISSIKNELKQKDISIIPIKGLPLIENWRLIWLKKKNIGSCKGFFKIYQRQ